MKKAVEILVSMANAQGNGEVTIIMKAKDNSGFINHLERNIRRTILRLS
ncbi:MAG: hypothetical protein MZV49_13355 [Rhodopseudomonas palustris]|nr:hypothetical protein [Rhodopseudomonas palustris]